MSAIPNPQAWTVEAYFALEAESETRHEYLNGEIVAMVGATEGHNQIVGNVLASLHGQLRGRDCRVFANDMRVRVSATAYTYPDVLVVCGDRLYTDEKRQTLTNPTLIIEVLSPSTERYDRVEKFVLYRSLASLQTYVLIAQSGRLIEVYERQAEDRWLLTLIKSGDVPLDTIQCVLNMETIYENVNFLPYDSMT